MKKEILFSGIGGQGVMNLGEMPGIFNEVFTAAFDFKAVFGGFTGSCVMMGIKRGLFSNEAGMGSAPNAAAAASVSYPTRILCCFIFHLLYAYDTIKKKR